ncbi:MAG: hypothetical protein JNG85_12260 [Spirochaetaceae bacterium]|nr:hypothetical protein [Spirochaetaceae bacterium]
MNIRPIGPVAAALCLSAALASAQPIEAFKASSPREIAMGGSHAAVADDFYSLLANPAAMVAVKPELFASRLAIGASGPVFDLANLMLGGGDIMTALADLLAKNDYKLYAGLEIAGPLAFGYVGEGLGFGLFNRTRMSLNSASVTSLRVLASEDILLTGGYAYRFLLGKGHALDLGLLAKGFIRGELDARDSLVGIQNLISGSSSILARPFYLTTGIGFDLGLRWNWEERFSAGLVCRDAYSPGLISEYTSLLGFVGNPGSALTGSRSAKVPTDLAVGGSWSPDLGILGRYVDDFILAIDYRDILDLARPMPRNAILNLGLGLEVRALDIISVRIGFSEALLAAGIGFDLGAFKLEAAAWGSELSDEPGGRPIYNLLLAFDFIY